MSHGVKVTRDFICQSDVAMCSCMHQIQTVLHCPVHSLCRVARSSGSSTETLPRHLGSESFDQFYITLCFNLDATVM